MFEVKVDRIEALIEYTLTGRIEKEEMRRFLDELRPALLSLQGREIKIKADLRGFKPVAPEVAEMIREAQELGVSLGVRRIAEVVGSDIVALQLNRVARESGTHRIVRCFWDEDAALDWLAGGDSGPVAGGGGAE